MPALDVLPDSTLWKLVLKDDEDAFESIVDRHQSTVSGIAYSICGDFITSQDITQDTFLAAWRCRADLQDHDKLAAWLCGICRNLAYRSIRRDRQARDSMLADLVDRESSAEDPAVQSISKEESSLVWQTIESMPENYREVLVLFYREGRSVGKVAHALDISEDAVKQRLSRGRELVRQQLSETVEEVLVRSKPGKLLTRRTMAGVAAIIASSKIAGSAVAAGPGLATGIGTSAVIASAKSAAGLLTFWGAMGGALGGLIGIGGGWLGTWIPAQLAPTMTERKLLMATGRHGLLMSAVFTLVLVLSGVVCSQLNSWQFYMPIFLLSMLAFFTWVTIASLRMQRQIRTIRATITSEDDPNPSMLRKQFRIDRPSTRIIGRRYTSRWKLLGLPLVDIQFSDFVANYDEAAKIDKAPAAFGWIAIGEVAMGLVAIGGRATGVIACGALALGIFAVGGLSVGGLAVGGGAVAAVAIGGGAIGYDAAGGVTLGWHSATGGCALAKHASFGGVAIAVDFAEGAIAQAKEVNTELAKKTIQEQTMRWLLEWQRDHMAIFIAMVVFLSVWPLMLSPLFFRREKSS